MQLLLDEQACKYWALKFKVLSDENRIDILLNLIEEPDKYYVGELLKELLNHIEQPTLSHHLKILKWGNMAKDKKIGLNVYYFVIKESLVELVEFLNILIDIIEEREKKER